MAPLNYSIPTVVLSISFYVLFIGGGNGPNVYATNTSGSWTYGMLLTINYSFKQQPTNSKPLCRPVHYGTLCYLCTRIGERRFV